MKVCLLNLPWEQHGMWGIRAGCRFPNVMPRGHNTYVPFPFLLAYTASYLESVGIEVLLIDGVAERCSTEDLFSRVVRFRPELVLAETATTSLSYDIAILTRLKSLLSDCRIALYGPHVSVRPQDAMEHDTVDFVICGEPEETTLELARSIEQHATPKDLLGLSYRQGSNCRVNQRRPLIADIDALPYPKREGLPMEAYSVPGYPSPVAFMYGSRGCPFRCTFCLWPQTLFERGSYRPRAPEKIAEETAWVLAQFPKTRSVFFDDDTFNLGRDRLIRFAHELERLGINIPWGMNARADSFDEELLQRLVGTGLFNLRIGIESGDPTVLARSRKGIRLEEAERTLILADKLGVKNHVSFIVGLPGESKESVERTIRFARSVPVDSVQFSVAVPFPGTDLYRDAQQNGHLVTKDWRKFNGADSAVMRTDSLSAEEVMEQIAHARRRVYFSFPFIKRRLSFVRAPSDLKAIFHKALRLLTHRLATRCHPRAS